MVIKMEFYHKPVLKETVINFLNPKPGEVIIDGTFGGGGHALEIARQLNTEGVLIVVDRDEQALEAGKKKLNSSGAQVIFVHDNFANMDEILKVANFISVDGILLDLGVSSFQLDQVERGFSYQDNAPLDMRMDQQQSLTAQEIINTYPVEVLEQIIKDYGEEKWSRRIAQFIINERAKKKITTTGELVKIIKAAIPKGAREKGPHPAKRTFQALRIYVNQELNNLTVALEKGIQVLNRGGRFVVITFHSLEDRIVKRIFKYYARACVCPSEMPVCQCSGEPLVKHLTKKPILPDEGEIADNPRARSAKLRAVEKL